MMPISGGRFGLTIRGWGGSLQPLKSTDTWRAFANDYNARALDHCLAALSALKERTQERMSRKVEGTHTV